MPKTRALQNPRHLDQIATIPIPHRNQFLLPIPPFEQKSPPSLPIQPPKPMHMHWSPHMQQPTQTSVPLITAIHQSQTRRPPHPPLPKLLPTPPPRPLPLPITLPMPQPVPLLLPPNHVLTSGLGPKFIPLPMSLPLPLPLPLPLLLLPNHVLSTD